MHRRAFLQLTALAVAGCSAPRAAAAPQGLATRWDTDPWSRGSYSALPVGTSYRVRYELADALIAGRIALAGEYAAPDYPATVHGAYLSGQRAARKVADAQSVLVIGAGVAGLRAAQVLQAAGKDVTVLEARDRIGGRIHTDHSLGVALEKGAAWVHGVRGNPLLPVVREAGLTLVPTDYEDSVAHTRDGEPLRGAGPAENRLWCHLLALGKRNQPRADSAAEALRERGWRADSAARRLVQHAEIDLEYGLPAAELGAQALYEGTVYRGGDSLVQGGFEKVPALLARGLDIRLDTPVDKVSVGDGVRAAGLTADAAVVAVPLALLQQDRPGLPWPTRLRNRLDALTTGTLEKAFLRYSRPWWPRRQVLQIAGTPGQRWSEWYNLAPLVSAPVIFGFCGGGSTSARPGDDSALLAEAQAILSRAFG